jgi:pimeloyl-ACP methyl ester carboxylesterase
MMSCRQCSVGDSATRRIPGPNGELEVEDHGDGGTPVLFVHGNGGSSRLWRSQLEHLAHSRRALAVDLHGFGLSEGMTTAPYSVESFATDLEAVTRSLQFERLVVVGHSLGGAVVARFAVSHRELVAGALYVDSVGDTRMPASKATSFAVDLKAGGEPDRANEWFQGLLIGARARTRELVLAELARASREAVVQAFLALTRVDPSRWIAGFGGPALHVFVPRFNRGPSSLSELLPSLPSVRMEGVSHWPMIDEPQAFNRHLDLFLEGVESASAAETQTR